MQQLVFTKEDEPIFEAKIIWRKWYSPRVTGITHSYI